MSFYSYNADHAEIVFQYGRYLQECRRNLAIIVELGLLNNHLFLQTHVASMANKTDLPLLRFNSQTGQAELMTFEEWEVFCASRL